jgi:SEC-C motif
VKIGRNHPCPCGSGQKFKKCHGRIGREGPSATDESTNHLVARERAAERIREQQQGLGRPIISLEANDNRIVAVRNRLFWSGKWKTVPDFLEHYIATVLEAEWGKAELGKPLSDRHPIMQWYDAYSRYKQQLAANKSGVFNAEVNGVVACYLGVAYSLYLLDHNVDLQSRLIRRLKDVRQFQGAYYEILIAGILLRAGFYLTLENEEDTSVKHCEFSAVSKRTGKKFWVEAKMRAARVF